MGRCNNRRTQEAAEKLRSTPARARFSSLPAGRSNSSRNNNRRNQPGNTDNSNNGTSAATGAPFNRPGNTGNRRNVVAAGVVDKLSKRLQSSSSDKNENEIQINSVAEASTSRPQLGQKNRQRTPTLHGVDISKLDELTLSDESIVLITQLLKKLNVVENFLPSKNNEMKYDENSFRQTEEDYKSEGEEDLYNKGAKTELQFRHLAPTNALLFGAATGGYTEYEDDAHDDNNSFDSDNDDVVGYFPNIQDGSNLDYDGQVQDPSLLDNVNDMQNFGNIPDSIRNDPVFIHLTNKLSFPENIAMQACSAIESWSAINDVQRNQADVSSSSQKLSNPSNATKLSYVLDWICLHIPEKMLQIGFKPNPKSKNNNSTSGGVEVRRVIKPIPHPSINVAKKITEDIEWQRSMILEDRAIQFLKFGFHHNEVIRALQTFQDDIDTDCNLFSNRPDNPLDDDAVLRQLLENLEIEATNENGENKGFLSPGTTGDITAVDDESLQFEMEQEREALSAIYEGHFEVIMHKCTNGNDLKGSVSQSMRYKLSFTPSEPAEGLSLQDSVCDLHVFIRCGYPLVSAPLFLLYNAKLSWTLLRNINVDIIRQTTELQGAPLIFEIMSYLTDMLAAKLKDYNKQERTRAFEQMQTKIRREAGHEISDDDDDIHPHDISNLSRRQRARIKGAEKAYDREEKEKAKDEERLKRQSERLERIVLEQKSFRQTLADGEILKREKERHAEEIHKLTRTAMTAALNSGKGVDESRKAAQEAEVQYRTNNGLQFAKESQSESKLDSNTLLSKEQGESHPEIAGKPPHSDEVGKSTKRVGPTPQTASFVGRLRKMYTDAANVKGAYKLTEQSNQLDADDDFKLIPRPVSFPVGDIAQIMEEQVIAVQKEQPWLVSPEARIPCIAGSREDRNDNLSDLQMQINRQLKDELERNMRKPSQQVRKIREQTKNLPAHLMREEIVRTIYGNQVTLISASTGAGKTTVVPGLVLNAMILNDRGSCANIIVCQPRRISAIGVAERIASERGERVGETCGYSIKLERKLSKKTRILLCTTGILLRRLQIDPDLANVSHVIVDEVHERDIDSDFALLILKDLITRRKALKLILMSATFDEKIFSDYFGGCATVSIPGRAHPVQEFRLEDVLQLTGYEVKEGSDYAVKGNIEGRLSKTALRKLYYPKYDVKTIHSLSIANEAVINYELLAALVQHICLNSDDGAILIFMPGLAEISNAIDEIRRFEFFQSDKVVIYPLHSSLATSDQRQVFEIPPAGVRKIVVATNIAETSITVADVVYVIDSGRVKENRRDEIKEAPTLVECWISRASAQQRRGRAGRVRPGIAYHMFPSHTYNNDMAEYQLPEMSRVGLEDLVLQILILDLGQPSVVLSKAITPPSAVAMKNSFALLEELGAIECKYQPDHVGASHFDAPSAQLTELTALGFHLATLPVEPRIGKLIIYGALFKCVEPALTIAAAMSTRSPFLSPFDNREAAEAARKNFSIDMSDHLTILEAFDTWRILRDRKGDRAAKAFAHEHFLSTITLFQIEELRKQFASLLMDIGFLPKEFRLEGKNSQSERSTKILSTANENASNLSLLKAVLSAGTYPNLIVAPRSLVDGSSRVEAGEVAFQSRGKGPVYLHPCTLAFSGKKLDNRYFCYGDIMQTKKLYVRDVTAVPPFALLLFGGALHIHHREGVVSVDDWLKFRVTAKPATLVKHLRGQMENMLLQKIIKPEEDVTSTDSAKALIDSISTLLQREGYGPKKESLRNDGADIVRPWHGNDERKPSGRGSGPRSHGSGRGRKIQGRGRGLNGRG